jgi:excinuclease ABC subunit B
VSTKPDELADAWGPDWDPRDAVRPQLLADRAFRLVSDMQPMGSQPQAIAELDEGLSKGEEHQVLLGITGSGKTFTVANLIAKQNRPALILAHNKTLAAQLYSEFKSLFPDNAVEYFVSYYDYYQPEAYVASTDTFIEKDSNINDQIDRMRHSATFSLLSRRDVIIVASVSCIFGIGSAEAYYGMVAAVSEGETISRDKLLHRLVAMQYERNDMDFHRGTFRVRGDIVEVFPAYEEDRAVRIEFFGDEVEAIHEIDPLRGTSSGTMSRVTIFPASHYVTPASVLRTAIGTIQDELHDRLQTLRAESKLLEAQRLEQRTMFDIEMLEQMGRCSGIENYSRHLSKRAPGDPPPTLLDYFPDDFMVFVDESHVTIPQVRSMLRGDRSRKQTLVDHGFRLPSALDNRPLDFDEWEDRTPQVTYVSATPGDYEIDKVEGVVTEQIIRPTGLLDPEIEIRPISGQVDDLFDEIQIRAKLGQRVLVTTLTKRMAEDLTEYYADLGVRVRYLHSDIDTLERVQLLRSLRLGEYDVLVGINLLREGLDLPEVSLVAILDADKEGFLRARRSLIQTCGRAARNLEGRVIMYADRITDSMRACIDETERRRAIQGAYNREHGVEPKSVTATLGGIEIEDETMARGRGRSPAKSRKEELEEHESDLALPPPQIKKRVEELRGRMKSAAKELQFEEAAILRDRIRVLEMRELDLRGLG